VKVSILSLGCSKNSVDSENLIGLLESSGVEIVSDVGDADVALVNTCGFIQPAVEESINAILDLELLKEQGKIKKIGVLGCLVNRYGEELKKELPSVDVWAKAEEWDLVAHSLGLFPLKKKTPRGMMPETRSWSRYLKVGEGCDTFCSYCTIPSIRGRARSIPIEELSVLAADLAEKGAREICLVGQDLTIYGRDLYGEPRLTELLSVLDRELPKDVWIRLLYLHPSRINERFIDFIAGHDRILSYLDIPVQHIDPVILKRMNRPPDEEHIRRVFSYAREADKYFALRTTIMVGFPGETEQQFTKVLDFLEKSMIDRVGAFIFSPEEGTPAAGMENQIASDIKEARYLRLMELQSEISLERQRLFEGKKLTVLVDEVDEEDGTAWSRSYRDAPEIDGLVAVSCGASLLEEGQFVEVRITDAAEHDLFAEIAGE
jgi:ribosomal protein S12 methylthiotransferase